MKTKRIISLLLSLLVIVGMIPMSVFASDAGYDDGTVWAKSYEELTAALSDTDVSWLYIDVHKDPFTWPEGECTLNLESDHLRYVYVYGDWVIPENVTVNHKIWLGAYGSEASITCNGTWNRMGGIAELESDLKVTVNGTMAFKDPTDCPNLLTDSDGEAFYLNGTLDITDSLISVHKLILGDGAKIVGGGTIEFEGGAEGNLSGIYCPSGKATVDAYVNSSSYWDTPIILSGNMDIYALRMNYEKTVVIDSDSHIKMQALGSGGMTGGAYNLIIKGHLELDSHDFGAHFCDSGAVTIEEGGILSLRAGNNFGSYDNHRSTISGNGTIRMYADLYDGEIPFDKPELYGNIEGRPEPVAETITIWRSWVDGTCTHDWKLTSVVEPTCCLTGVTIYTCTKCGIDNLADEKPATEEHEFTFIEISGFTDRLRKICTTTNLSTVVIISAYDTEYVPGVPAETAVVYNAPAGVDYTIVYTDNDKPGTATASVTIGGITIYTTFEITGDELDAPVIKSSSVANTGKIKLTWAAVEGAVKYKVYRATSKTGKYSIMKTVTATSYINTSAKAGTRYYYYVVAVDANGNVSAKSSIVNRVCDLPRPTVTLSNVASTGKIKVSWTKVDGAAKYQVLRSTTKNGTYKSVKTTTSLSWTDTNTTAGKTYYYKVKAIHSNTNANSALTSYKSRMADLKRPTVSITTSSGKPKVSWAAVTGATKYQIYRSTSKTGTYKVVKTTTSKSWKDTTAKKGKTYYYKVVAVHKNSGANSAYSTVVSKKCTK